MSTLRPSSTQAFVNQVLVYSLATICASGSIGLGTVWMRNQISLTANSNRVLEAKIADVERHLAESTTAIEGEQDPAVLQRRNTEWRLGLTPPAQGQVVHITEDPVRHLVIKRNRSLYGDAAVAVTLPVDLRR